MSSSPLKDYMQKHGIPVTRANYLEIHYMGKPPNQISAEQEAEMPEELQLPVAEEEGMPNPPGDKGKKR